uniref:Monocyte differentiation antigen CD14 n=1 Tax=Cyclopterus lumpus TaxID=8103 RepID=A0A8C3A072_CYCLU
MALHPRMILFLLLGLSVTSEAATSLCVLDMTRCVCKVMAIHNPQGLDCFEALELELRDGKLDDSSEVDTGKYSNVLSLLWIDKLIFNNVTISSSFISAVTPFLPFLRLSKINIISSTLKGVQPLKYPELPKASNIETLLLEDVRMDSVLLQPSFKQWLFGSLRSLVLVRCGLVEIDCSWAQTLENLAQLDLSENPISFTSMQNISHCPSLLFNLKSLHLRRSNLTSLQSLCTLLSLTPALTVLDVSRNNFSIVHYPHCLQLKPLRMLNLYNSLEVFNNPPLTLKKLNLSHNRLIRYPSLGHLSHLQDLKVDSNQFTILLNETGVVLNSTPVPPVGFTQNCVKATGRTQPNDSPLCLTFFVGFLSYLVYFGCENPFC